MASNIYATQIFEEKFEEWRSKIRYRLPKDGTANAIFVTCEQWENMKVYPALDKFKKKISINPFKYSQLEETCHLIIQRPLIGAFFCTYEEKRLIIQ